MLSLLSELSSTRMLSRELITIGVPLPGTKYLSDNPPRLDCDRPALTLRIPG